MVKASESAAQKTSTSRLAGQAPSPQNPEKRSTAKPNPRARVPAPVVGPKVEGKSAKEGESPVSPCSSTNSPKSKTGIAHAAAVQEEEASDSDTSQSSCFSATGSAKSKSGSESFASSPEPDPPHESALDRKKRELVDIGMAAFNEVFQMALTRHIARLTAHGSGNGGGSREPGKPLINGKSGTQPSGGQKRQLNDRDDEEGADDLGNGSFGDRNGNKRIKKHERRFACPFFKHDIDRYRLERTCCGPGWMELHRLKEHLLRKHSLPQHICRRCYASFKSETELSKHQRSETLCAVKKETENPWDGFDEAKGAILRARQKATSDIERWREIYHLLFPDEPIPSPFYDESEDQCGSPSSALKGGRGTRSSRDIAEYGRYLQRAVSPRVRRELECEVEKGLNIFSENMKLKAVEIFRNMQIKQFFSWADRNGASSAGGSGSGSGTGTSISTSTGGAARARSASPVAAITDGGAAGGAGIVAEAASRPDSESKPGPSSEAGQGVTASRPAPAGQPEAEVEQGPPTYLEDPALMELLGSGNDLLEILLEPDEPWDEPWPEPWTVPGFGPDIGFAT